MPSEGRNGKPFTRSADLQKAALVDGIIIKIINGTSTAERMVIDRFCVVDFFSIIVVMLLALDSLPYSQSIDER